jgi:hypothetical protein
MTSGIADVVGKEFDIVIAGGGVSLLKLLLGPFLISLADGGSNPRFTPHRGPLDICCRH